MIKRYNPGRIVTDCLQIISYKSFPLVADDISPKSTNHRGISLASDDTRPRCKTSALEEKKTSNRNAGRNCHRWGSSALLSYRRRVLNIVIHQSSNLGSHTRVQLPDVS